MKLVTTSRSTSRSARRGTFVVALAAVLALAAPTAQAQDGEPPGPDEIREKIVEVERLMKKAEATLARATSSETSAAEAARRIEELLEKKAQAKTGKSCEQLRKEARDGSAESAEVLKRLTEEAKRDAAEAGAAMKKLVEEGGDTTRESAKGVRALIESTCESGKQAREGIEWLLRLRGQ